MPSFRPLMRPIYCFTLLHCSWACSTTPERTTAEALPSETAGTGASIGGAATAAVDQGGAGGNASAENDAGIAAGAAGAGSPGVANPIVDAEAPDPNEPMPDPIDATAAGPEPAEGGAKVHCIPQLEPRISAEYTWEPLNWTGLKVADVSPELRIFDNAHPSCATYPEACAAAESESTIGLRVEVFFIDSAIWSNAAQLTQYTELVNRYYAQARIVFDFVYPAEPAPAWTENIAQLTLMFAAAMPAPSGETPDGFGNLPAGKAVLNDQLLEREDNHANPHFLVGKPLGHELGHVLGLAHVTDTALLMAQGTAPQNALGLLPEQALVVRLLALQRFGGVLDPVPCP